MKKDIMGPIVESVVEKFDALAPDHTIDWMRNWLRTELTAALQAVHKAGKEEPKRCGKAIPGDGIHGDGICGVILDCHLHDWRAAARLGEQGE